jgi:SAM-dependent methyltransferase
MISLNNEPCCICGQTRSLLVQEATYPEHGYPGSFCLRKCSECGLLFNSPRLDDAELGQLYGRNYYFFNRPDASELQRIVPMYARTIALVADKVAAKVTLDVGCGRGYLPAVLSKLGWDARGVEISREASQYARRRFGLQHIFTGTIEQYIASPDARSFPLVTAIDVIEHVPAPDAFVASLARVVDRNGLLIIDTPNAGAHNAPAGEAWVQRGAELLVRERPRRPGADVSHEENPAYGDRSRASQWTHGNCRPRVFQRAIAGGASRRHRAASLPRRRSGQKRDHTSQLARRKPTPRRRRER